MAQSPQPRSGRTSQKPRRPNAGTLPVLNPDTAGIDVGATALYVAVPPDRDPQPLQVFGTFTEDLHTLARWLLACRIRSVAMEATGVFWIPIFQILEGYGFEVCLVNARHLKNVTGRKTDVVDAQWLQHLHAVGLLSPSFRPPEAICAIRTILRYRETLVTQGATQIQHMQKALTQMNLHLHHVLSDLSGVSGLRIIAAILAGERDPEKLAELRDPGVKAAPEDVVKALRGDWRAEHLFVLRQAYELYLHYQSRLQACDAEVEQLLAAGASQADPKDVPPPPKNAPRGKQRKNQIQLPKTDLRTELFRLYGTDLTQVPGLGPGTVANLHAELGTDLAGAFGTGGRFCSWQGLCPDPRKSGGKVLRHQTRQVKHRVAKLFRLAAQSLHHSQTALGEFYRRMQAKLGPAQAITATAHKLARIFFHLVTTKEAYDETIFAREEERHQQRRLKRVKQLAAHFGYDLVPRPETCVS
jgi:transposase